MPRGTSVRNLLITSFSIFHSKNEEIQTIWYVSAVGEKRIVIVHAYLFLCLILVNNAWDWKATGLKKNSVIRIEFAYMVTC